MDDLADALKGARTGDVQSLGALYELLNPALMRYMRRHVGRAAPDLASEVWIGLTPAIPGFEGAAEHLRALMFTIARRRVVDHHRRSVRQVRTVPLEDGVDPPDAQDTEALAVEALTTESVLQRLGADLPADQAQVVLLRVVGGLDGHRVAATLGKSAGAVRVAQHRALHDLRRRWERGRERHER